MPLLLAIAWFELRQQLRSHVFWIVVAVSAAMVAGAVWSPDLRVGLSDTDRVSGVDFTIRTHLVWSLFYLFTAAAFAGDAVLRDEQTGFAPIIGATPVPRRTHLLGRFVGAYLVVALCYLSVPAALQVAARPNPAVNLYALAVFGLPNLFVATALFLTLATLSRSLGGAMLGAVALLGLYGMSVGTSGWSLAEPFGFAAYAEATSGWTAAERAHAFPAFSGPIMLNRCTWAVLSVALLVLLLRVPNRRRGRVAAAPKAEPAVAATASGPLALAMFDTAARIGQFSARTRLELNQILFTPVFATLLLLGLAHAGSTLWRLDPATSQAGTFATLAETFQLTPIVVAFFFAGELYWAERDRRVHDLVAAAPVPDAALILPKLMALSLALLGLAVASAAAVPMVALVKETAWPAPAALTGWALLKWWDWTLYGVLALALQALSPTKLAGWGLFVLFLIGSLALERSGLADPIYRYAEYSTHPVPEPFAGAPLSLYRLYWTGLAALLTALAVRLAGRAGHDPLGVRWRRLSAGRARTRPPGRRA